MTPLEYHLSLPNTLECGAVFSSPHSGRDYPAAFLENSPLDEVAIRSSEDAFVDQLFHSAVDEGAPFISASAPRAYVDLNRNADELDPAVIEGVRLVGSNPRIASGLGVIPRVVSHGRVVVEGKISPAEAKHRLERFYYPYHQKLQALLQVSKAVHGKVLLIDCHSMPHDALANVSGRADQRPEIILGDRFGASCEGVLVGQIEAMFQGAGFRVARNVPFAGAYITQAYGRPNLGQNALQIEIDRALYMDEKRVVKSDHFEEIQARLSGVVREICELTRWKLKMAAE